MSKNLHLRIIVALIMLISIFWGFWWFTWCLAICLLFYFPFYIEIIFIGLLYDSLYGISLPEFWNIDYIFTLASVVLFLISLIVKKRLTAYEA